MGQPSGVERAGGKPSLSEPPEGSGRTNWGAALRWGLLGGLGFFLVQGVEVLQITAHLPVENAAWWVFMVGNALIGGFVILGMRRSAGRPAVSIGLGALVGIAAGLLYSPLPHLAQQMIDPETFSLAVSHTVNLGLSSLEFGLLGGGIGLVGGILLRKRIISLLGSFLSGIVGFAIYGILHSLLYIYGIRFLLGETGSPLGFYGVSLLQALGWGTLATLLLGLNSESGRGRWLLWGGALLLGGVLGLGWYVGAMIAVGNLKF